ncbi:MAG: response regulator [Bacteroidetes bacterium]|nr:response regulator [Bacteroidota bacterium]
MMEEKCFKILIVEDEEISRNLYRLWLKNYDLSFCDSEKSMYDTLSDKIFELIIMDIGLPGSKDGLSLIKELKSNKDFLKIPIACVTSYDSPEQKGNVLNAGADAYLAKPIPKNILINVISKFQPLLPK